MNDKRLETVFITLGTVLCAAAFLFALGLPKAFFILVIALNLGLCLGVEWIANFNNEYPLAYLMASIATLAMAMLGYYHVHIAFTFIPSAIVAGFIGASTTRESDSNILFGALISIVTFLMAWFVNLSLMMLC